MTGRYSWRTAVKHGKVLAYNAPRHIETTRVTLASVFKSGGFATGGFGKWHLGWTTERVTDWSQPIKPGPLEAGFDYHGGQHWQRPAQLIENEEVTGSVPGQSIRVNGDSRAGDITAGIESGWQPDRVMDRVTERVTGWIETNRAKPFFVTLHRTPFMSQSCQTDVSPTACMAPTATSSTNWIGALAGSSTPWTGSSWPKTRWSSSPATMVGSSTRQPWRQRGHQPGLAIGGALRGGKHTEYGPGRRLRRG